MFDWVLVMVALAAGMGRGPAPETAAPAAPAFPAPAQDSARASAPAAPVFLAPSGAGQAGQAGQMGQAGAKPAAPAFLAPAPGAAAAEPQIPTGRFTTATEVRPILNATRGNWVALRDFNGQDLLYLTHLWAWRCGLAELRIGINGAPPAPVPLPPCHLDQAAPNAITESDGLPYLSFPRGSVARVEVQITYDDLGTDGARFDRAAVLMP